MTHPFASRFGMMQQLPQAADQDVEPGAASSSAAGNVDVRPAYVGLARQIIDLLSFDQRIPIPWRVDDTGCSESRVTQTVPRGDYGFVMFFDKPDAITALAVVELQPTIAVDVPSPVTLTITYAPNEITVQL